jgi:hypothetical protein
MSVGTNDQRCSNLYRLTCTRECTHKIVQGNQYYDQHGATDLIYGCLDTVEPQVPSISCQSNVERSQKVIPLSMVLI